MARPPPTSILGRIWFSRWPFLRLVVCVWLLIVLIRDNPSRLTRLQVAAMPNYAYVSEVENLRSQGRYGEAMVVVAAGREVLNGSELISLNEAAQKVQDDQSSWMRKAKEFGIGAVVGQGQSIEAISGAITADMLFVGNFRDLIIQGSHQIVDGECDKLLLALSATGIAMDLLPEIEWMDAVVKVARKSGKLSEKVLEEVVRVFKRAVDTHDVGELRKVTDDMLVLGEHTSPEGLINLLPEIESTEEIAKVADFTKEAEDGAFVLHVAKREGVEIIDSGDQEALEALRLGARKGDRGMAWLRTGKKLMRPHPLIGVIKGMYKGNIPKFVLRLSDDVLDPYGWLILPLLLLWAAIESVLVYSRIFGFKRLQAIPVQQEDPAAS